MDNNNTVHKCVIGEFGRLARQLLCEVVILHSNFLIIVSLLCTE